MVRRISYVVIAALSLLTQLGGTASAISAAQRTVFKEGIYYYNTEDDGTTECGSSTLLSGDGNGQKAYNFFVSKRLSPAGAAGIVGNMTEESTGVDPERLQGHFSGEQPAESPEVQALVDDSVTGWGIVQWTPPNKIITKSHDAGTPYTTIDTLGFQLDFLWEELSTSYSSLVTQLKSETDPQTAATDFLTGFERGSPSPTRQAAAQAYYDLATKNTPLPPNIAVSHNDGGGDSTTTGTVTSGSTCASGGSASAFYKNPLRDVSGLVPERIDEGVDYSGTGPVYAAGNGTVVETDGSGWPGGVFIVYQLADGPAAGKYIYFAEDCKPSVKVGDKVTSSTTICTMYNGGSGVETGWAQPPSAGDIAMARDVYIGHDGLSTAFGQNFSEFMKAIGAPPGNPNGSTSFPGVSGGTLPSGWPTW